MMYFDGGVMYEQRKMITVCWSKRKRKLFMRSKLTAGGVVLLTYIWVYGFLQSPWWMWVQLQPSIDRISVREVCIMSDKWSWP